MNVGRVVAVAVLAAALQQGPVAAPAQAPAGKLLAEAQFLEEARADFEGAIRLYRQVADGYPGDRELAARALLRLGDCYARLGRDGAAAAYRRLLERYSDQPQAAIARRRLDGLLRPARAASGATTGSRLREITLGGRKVDGLLSRDGTRVLHASTEKIFVHDFRTGESRVVFTMPPSEGWIGSLGWSPDERRVSFDVGRFARNPVAAVLEVATGKHRIWLGSNDQYVVPLGWAPDGRLLCGTYRDPGQATLVLVAEDGATASFAFDPEAGRRVYLSSVRLDPTGRCVAFSSDAGSVGKEEVRVAALEDPLRSTVVAPHPTSRSVNPVWSPDGRHLLFQSNRRSMFDLWAVELSGGKPVGEPFLVKRSIGEVTLRDWLSDGSLVYTASTELRDVWIQPIDPATGITAGRSYPIGGVRGYNAQPAWSRDGTRVVYRSKRPVNDGPGLYITRLDDGTEREIRLPPSVLNPAWSIDGTIVYQAHPTEREPHRLVAVDPATGATRTFLTLDMFKPGFTPILDFSPDGRELLFDVTVEDPVVGGLYVFDGREVRKIPGTEGARPGRWMPDGAEIVFLRGAENTFYTIRPDGTGMRRVCDVPAGFFVRYFAVAPDGRRLVYCRSPRESPQWELWLASLDGTVHRRIDLQPGLQPMHVDWSPDGRNLALGIASDGGELWVLEGFWPPGK